MYRVAVQARLKAYHFGLFPRRRLPVFVLSVGNLSVGGTGKTPTVEMIATWALQQGYKPAILSRGYGGHFKGKVLVVSDGTRIMSEPFMSGDEPYFLAKRLPGIPVIIAKARYNGGHFAWKELESDFLIMDDGFQHIQLERDLNVVLLDSTNPFGNGYLLPRGPLREPVRGLERADALILTRCKSGEAAEKVRKTLSEKIPMIPVFHGDHVPLCAVFPANGEENRVPISGLRGKRVIGFAGIAHPAYFRATLESLGMDILAFEPFRDHHVYTPQDINNFLEKRDHLHADYILMTGKDWVKVEQTGLVSREMGYLDIKFRLVDEEERFFRLVKDAYERKQGRVHGSRFTAEARGILAKEGKERK